MTVLTADHLLHASLFERRVRLVKFVAMGRKPRALKSRMYRRDRVLAQILSRGMNYRAKVLWEAHLASGAVEVAE